MDGAIGVALKPDAVFNTVQDTGRDSFKMRDQPQEQRCHYRPYTYPTISSPRASWGLAFPGNIDSSQAQPADVT